MMDNPWFQRLVTIVVASGVFVAAGLVPAMRAELLMLGSLLTGWLIPHPADVPKADRL